MNARVPASSIVALLLSSLAACEPGADSIDQVDEVDQDVVIGGGIGRLDVFVMDNDDTRNRVIGLHRDPTTGALSRIAAFPTGGRGTAAGLGSQGSLVLDETRTHLYAANAGSNEISVFEIRGSYLVLRDIVKSAGGNPISLTVSGDLLYVLNGGREDNPASIAGFRLGDESMTPIPGSRRPLSAAMVAPAQIQFSPAGDVLVVTEKATNNITTYLVDEEGRASQPIVTPSHGQTPFGFAFDRNGTLIVSEAFGGAAGASAMSSYALGADGVPTLISGSVPTGQTAACWVAIGERPFAYTTNTGSDNVSGYRVRASGVLERLGDGALAPTSDVPIDADFNGSGSYLYVLAAGTDTIDIFTQNTDGSLVSAGHFTGLPASTVGIAAR